MTKEFRFLRYLHPGLFLLASPGMIRKRVIRTGLAVTQVLLLLGGGAAAGAQTPGNAHANHRALLVMVVGSRSDIRAVLLKSDDGGIYIKKNIGSGAHVVIFHLKQGHYCLSKVRFKHKNIDLGSYGKQVCFPAVDGIMGYIGHYVFSPHNGDRQAGRYDRLDIFREIMRKHYPGLIKKYQIMDLLDLHAT